MIKIVKYFLEAIVIYLFFLFGKLIGLTFSRKVFSFIFKKIGPLIKSSEVTSKNLNIYNQKLSNDSKRIILDNMWSNFGMTFIEYIYLSKFKKENFHTNIVGKEILDKITFEKNPVIFVSGHFANFELMSMEITRNKIDLATIYRPLNNIFLNPFMEYLRKTYVCSNQIKKGLNGVKESIKYINQGVSIALMIDQRVSEGQKLKFFNKDCFTTTLPAQLAIKYNLKIVPVYIERKKNNFFDIEFYNPINVSEFKNKSDLSKKLNLIMERMILKNPNQWIWTHDRWK